MTDSAELYTGRTLGHYELLVPIAEGATAQVWAARTRGAGIEKIVAVKLMLTDAGGDVDAESMFLDEARLVARIRHPNVVTVLDLGEDEDALYLVMEWIEGEPLQVVLREVAKTERHRLPLPLAVRIVKLAASGLHAAHDLCDEAGKPVGLVHRDVSPANIMIGYDGVVRVIDFGVAKATSNMQRTRIGQIKGKVAYMAPEQAVGEAVDRRTDVFALGLVLYQLVTGKHPFRGDSEYATLARIRDPSPAAPPRTHVPDLPPALEAVMEKALAKPREARYPTMLDFARALEQAVPSPPDVDRVLGAFMSKLLLHRAQKREHAILDALTVVNGGAESQTRPVNFGVKPLIEDADVSSGIRPVGGLLGGAEPAAPEAAAAPGASQETPRPATPRVELATPAVTRAGVDPGELPEGMRPPRTQAKRIAIAIGVVLAVVVGLVAMLGGSSGSDQPPTKHAF